MDSRRVLEMLKAGTLDRGRVQDPAVRLVVRFADWLAFPTELGKYPDELDLLDARSMHWPTAGRTLPLALLRYRVRDTSGLEPDDVGVGLVGSITFSLFSYRNEQRPVEDVYALHCYWECWRAGMLAASEDIPLEEMTAAIRSTGRELRNASPTSKIAFARLAPAANVAPLRYPGAEVIVVAGEYQGQAGWLACDGPRSRWYPASDMPRGCLPTTVGMVHVGRVLLGFPLDGVERRHHLAPEFVLAAPDFLAKYEQALAAARSSSADERGELFSSFGTIGEHALRYVTLLTSAGRSAEASAFIRELTPYWDHNAGYTELGKLAFEAKLFDLAKHFIEKLRAHYRHYYRSEAMALLARIYVQEGRVADGRALLHDCLERIRSDPDCSPREVVRFSEPLRTVLDALEGDEVRRT